MEFFDTHSHYNDEKFEEDREDILNKIYEAGITKAVVVGDNIVNSKATIELAKKYDFLFCAVGIHPCEIGETQKEIDNQILEIEKIANYEKNIAIGEIGLDYYWNKENKQIQKELFIKQIQLANKLNLPIVIHTREAVQDTLEILKKYPVKKLGVFHCCPLNRELVKEALKLGYYISFAGPITFKNSKNADEIITLVPNEKILIETDSPYLTPEPNRGKRNNPANVKYTAQKIADVKQTTLEEIAKITYDNACKIFCI